MLKHEGYAPEFIERVQTIVLRRDLKNDAEQQTLEDAICLTFLETQLTGTAAKLSETRMVDVLRKTMAKMSSAAVDQVAHLHLPHEARVLVGHVK